MRRMFSALSLIPLLALSVGDLSASTACVHCAPESCGIRRIENNLNLEAAAKITNSPERNPGGRMSERQFIDKVGRLLCRSMSKNNFAHLQGMLKKFSLRFLGREMKLEEAYRYLRCRLPLAPDIDLIRVFAEDPLRSDRAARELVDYFLEEVPDKNLLGKIIGCKKDIGYKCMDVLEHAEKNIKFSVRYGFVYRARALRKFRMFLRNRINDAGLSYDREFCRRYFLEELPHCGN